MDSASSPQESELLASIVEEIRRRLAVRRVILFGSRARGDARPRSDVDIAVDHESNDAAWADLVTQLQETAPTLLDLDLVDLRTASPDLRQKILTEGKVIYG